MEHLNNGLIVSDYNWIKVDHWPTCPSMGETESSHLIHQIILTLHFQPPGGFSAVALGNFCGKLQGWNSWARASAGGGAAKSCLGQSVVGHLEQRRILLLAAAAHSLIHGGSKGRVSVSASVSAHPCPLQLTPVLRRDKVPIAGGGRMALGTGVFSTCCGALWALSSLDRDGSIPCVSHPWKEGPPEAKLGLLVGVGN